MKVQGERSALHRHGSLLYEQPDARERAAMTREGFRNYFREWWHYEYTAAPLHAYDFPIQAR